MYVCVHVIFIIYSYVHRECISAVSDRRSVWPQAVSSHGNLCDWTLHFILSPLLARCFVFHMFCHQFMPQLYWTDFLAAEGV